MKRVMQLIDMLQDVDAFFEYLMAEAKKDKREQLAEELGYHRNWFVNKMATYRRHKKAVSI